MVDDARAWVEYATYEPGESAIRFHHRLVAIHPFPNGNGRHGRVAADYLAMALGRPRLTWGAAPGHAIAAQGVPDGPARGRQRHHHSPPGLRPFLIPPRRPPPREGTARRLGVICGRLWTGYHRIFLGAEASIVGKRAGMRSDNTVAPRSATRRPVRPGHPALTEDPIRSSRYRLGR